MEQTTEQTQATQVPEGMQVAYDSSGQAHYFPADFDQEKIGGIFSDMEISTIPQTDPARDLPTAGETNWLQRNADVPASISGSLAGAGIGSRFSPAGTIAGAVIGGAAGTFAGSAYSSSVTEGQANYDKAIADTLVSLGVDLGTGLVGKLIPDQAWSSAMKAMGIKPEQAAKMILEKAGTRESLQATQQFLESRGLSLTAYQTGAANGIRKIQERIASVGIFAQSSMGDYFEKVQGAIRDEMVESFNLTQASGATDLGSRLAGAIDVGKQALSSYYGDSLDKILQKINKGYTPATPLKITMSNILKENGIRGLVADVDTGEITERVIKSSLSDDALAFIRKEFSTFENLVAIDAKNIIALEKKITQKQREFRQANKFEAADDVERIGEQLKETYAQMLSQIDPVYGTKYADLKENYKAAVRNLIPEINTNIVNKALRSGDPAGLGELLLNKGSVSQVQAFMNSIHSVYALARKQGTLDELPFKKAEEMRQHIRRSYMANMFPEFLEEKTDLTKLIPKIDRLLGNKDANAKFKAMFGKDYPNAVKLFTAIKNTANNPSGDIGNLMFRSQEYGALRDLMAVLTAGTITGATTSSLTTTAAAMGGAVAILYTPVMMQKAVTNPKLANKLLGLTSTKFESRKNAIKAAGLVVNDFVNALDADEKESLTTYLEGVITEQRKALYDKVNSIGVQ